MSFCRREKREKNFTELSPCEDFRFGFGENSFLNLRDPLFELVVDPQICQNNFSLPFSLNYFKTILFFFSFSLSFLSFLFFFFLQLLTPVPPISNPRRRSCFNTIQIRGRRARMISTPSCIRMLQSVIGFCFRFFWKFCTLELGWCF